MCENESAGFSAAPMNFAYVKDGLSNTILLAEAYAWCEGRGRTAFLAWHLTGNDGGFPNPPNNGVHNFGLTYSLSTTQAIDFGNGPINITTSNGEPNPFPDGDLNPYFQIQPSTTATGVRGCNSLGVQSGHNVLNIALGDGSVRTVTTNLDRAMWVNLMLPRDGRAVQLD